MLIQRTLTKNKINLYHDTPVQELSDVDSGSRTQFCNWILAQDRISNILWTDESIFTRTGAVNFHNTHTWSVGNPHRPRPHCYQHQFSINVWAGIIDKHILGPFIFPERLNG